MLNYLENPEMIDYPLPWQLRGLQETSSGYGAKLTTRYKTRHNGRLYRVYATCYSNAASLWIQTAAGRLYIRN